MVHKILIFTKSSVGVCLSVVPPRYPRIFLCMCCVDRLKSQSVSTGINSLGDQDPTPKGNYYDTVKQQMEMLQNAEWAGDEWQKASVQKTLQNLQVQFLVEQQQTPAASPFTDEQKASIQNLGDNPPESSTDKVSLIFRQ